MELTTEFLSKLPMALRIEIEENSMRKDLSQSELATLQAQILNVIREHGSQQGRRTDLETCGPIGPEVQRRRATEVVGKVFGESRNTVERRLAVVSAAEANPEKFGKLEADMNRTGRVDGAYKRLKVARQAESIRAEPPPLPRRGPYRVIVADPPWPNQTRGEDLSKRGFPPYPPMSISEICAIDVASIAHPDCILWLWTTNSDFPRALQVLDSWGFEHKTILTWVKDRMGLGDWLRGQTEQCLVAVRGKPTVQLTNQTTALIAPVRAHSQKPGEFYGLVESLCPATRYCYLFSREYRDGWDMHGDEVPIAAS